MSDRKETPDLLSEILTGEPVQPIEKPAQPKMTPEKPKRSPRRKSTPRKTQKGWEYQIVSFQEYKGWRPRYINGKEVENWMDGPALDEYLAQAGTEGWELTTATSGIKMYGAMDKLQLYLKRPRTK